MSEDSILKEFRVTLETVTPLFLGGAEARAKLPELRPPSIRGALRYWLRTILGGVHGNGDISKISTAESNVFGNASESGSSSPIVIRLGKKRSPSIKSFSEIVAKKKVPRPEGGGMKTVIGKPGTAYLFFAARETTSEAERKALDGEFEVKIFQKPFSHKKTWNQVYVSLWLLTHFGGLGTRIHRGAGAVQVKDIEGEDELIKKLPLHIQSATPTALVEELKNGLKTCLEILGQPGEFPEINQPFHFDMLHPRVCKIWVVDKSYTGGWQTAIEEVGVFLQKFRNRRPKDYLTVKNAIVQKDQLANPVERAAFGLPLPFFFNSLGKKTATISVSLQNPQTHIEYERRASPMWIRPVKLSNGDHALVLLWFQSEFLPHKPGMTTQLSLSIDKVKHEPILGSEPNNNLLSTFLTGSDKSVSGYSLKDRGLSLLEVKYD